MSAREAPPTSQPVCEWSMAASPRILSEICGTLLAVFVQEAP